MKLLSTIALVQRLRGSEVKQLDAEDMPILGV
jgi:hypothetical protein